MTYTKAKMRIWNWKTYSKVEVEEAALFILASFYATPEDIQQAASVFV